LEHSVRFRKTRVLSLSRNRFTGFVPDDHLLLDVFTAPRGAVVDEISGEYVTLQHVYDISENFVGGSIPTWFAMYREYDYITVKLENNAFACPVPDAGALFIRGDRLRRRERGRLRRRERVGQEGPYGRTLANGGSGDGIIAAGITDERAYNPSSSSSAAEPSRSEGFLGFGSLETAAGAGALFAALLALSLLAHAAFRASLARQRRRALARDAFVDRLDDIGRRNAWGDVEMADRREGGFGR
jgi:hypothetical protein